MDLVVRAFRVLPGMEAPLQQFVAEVNGPRAAQVKDFYARFGVTHESWHLQRLGPDQSWVICVTHVGRKPLAQAAGEYQASAHGFDTWFKEQVARLSGVDPNVAPLGPATTLLFRHEG